MQWIQVDRQIINRKVLVIPFRIMGAQEVEQPTLSERVQLCASAPARPSSFIRPQLSPQEGANVADQEVIFCAVAVDNISQRLELGQQRGPLFRAEPAPVFAQDPCDACWHE